MERPNEDRVESGPQSKPESSAASLDFTIDIERRLSGRRELSLSKSMESVPTQLVEVIEVLRAGRWIDKELVDQFLSDLPPSTFAVIRNTFDKASSGRVKISTTMKIFSDDIRSEVEDLFCLEDNILAELGLKRTASGGEDILDELSILNHLGGPEWPGPRNRPDGVVASI